MNGARHAVAAHPPAEGQGQGCQQGGHLLLCRAHGSQQQRCSLPIALPSARYCTATPPYTHTLLRRYRQFMSLHAKYPNVLLVPTADIALMWAAHMGLSQQYAEACLARPRPASCGSRPMCA